MKNFLIILIVFLFFIPCLMLADKNDISNLFAPVYNTINVIADAEIDNPADIILKVNEDYLNIPKSNNLLNRTIYGKVSSLDVLVKKDALNKINNFVIFNDIKVLYYKDFSTFEKEEVRLCPNGICSEYNKYSIKGFDNFHSIQNSVCVSILHILSGRIQFFISYIVLFFSIFYFIKKGVSPPKINPYLYGAIFFALAFLMYSNGSLDYLPWFDEYQSINYSDSIKPFSAVFQDPGNPPLFYILLRGFITFFGITTYSMKIFPFLISILFLVILYLFLKQKYDIKTANIALFLCAVNIPLIYYAQETRSYILQAMFSPLLVWSLFNIFEKNRKKDYIIYGILTAIVSNIHYYEILLLSSNFIFAFIYFIYKKRYKDILKFFIANLLGILFFLPFFIKTAFNNALADSSFNTWIPDINFNQIKKCTLYLFGGTFSLIFSTIFFIRSIIKKNLIQSYLFSAIILTIFQAIVLSYLIRPMLIERYLVLLVPLFVIFLTLVFTDKYKSKYMVIFFLIWLIVMQGGMYEKNNRRKITIEAPLSFSKQFVEKEKPNKKVYAIINFSNPEYLEDKKEYMSDEITYVSKLVYPIEQTIEEILNKDKNAIIFTSNLLPDEKNSKNNHYKCYFNSSVDMCIWKIEK